MAGLSRDNLAKIAGPDSMAKPPQSPAAAARSAQAPSHASAANAASSSINATESTSAVPAKKKRHRAGRKNRKKGRKLSIIAPSEDTEMTDSGRPSMLTSRETIREANLDRLRTRKNSSTSLESEALLDHRNTGYGRARGYSNQMYSRSIGRSSMRPDTPGSRNTPRTPARVHHGPEIAVSDGEDDAEDPTDRTPLLKSGRKASKPAISRTNSHRNNRRTSAHSGASSTRRRLEAALTGQLHDQPHDVNNPPSMPTSPTLGSYADNFYPDIPSNLSDDGDAIIDIDGSGHRYDSCSDDEGGGGHKRRRPTGLDLSHLEDVCFPDSHHESEYGDEETYDGGDYGENGHTTHHEQTRRRRRRQKQWPNFAILEDWVREEKELRKEQEVLRAKKITEPVMFGGRLRPRTNTNWRAEEDNSFRFAYFNECFDTTIHAQNISNLLDDGNFTFQDLFKPEFPDDESESSSSEDEHGEKNEALTGHRSPPPPSINRSLLTSNPPSGQETPKNGENGKPFTGGTGKRTGRRPTFWLDVRSPTSAEMQVIQDAFGIHRLTTEDIMTQDPRDKLELFSHYYFLNYRTFEQDKKDGNFLEPINMSMVVFQEGVISFHHSMIPHPNNVRRRIRQLRDYGAIPYADWISYALVDDVTDAYQPLVNQIEFMTDEIDEQILNMHRAAVNDQTKAMAGPSKKVKRRPKGWRSWRIWRLFRAIFDSIYGLFWVVFFILKFVFYQAWKNIWDDLRTGGEEEIDEDEDGAEGGKDQADAGAGKSSEGDATTGMTGADMLRRVGETRKEVMALYRLMGNKADVVKSFAKRCNEITRGGHPRADIGMYLGDIHDHVVTMSGNLTHYESLLSRAHGNYVAQINIRMNERAEQNADVLGKLTVLGTIVLPMNIITGMWGMNVWVPGQDYEGDLTWFWCITAGLIGFGVTCYFIAKRVYGIV